MNVTKEPQEKSQMKLTVELSVEEFAPFIDKAAKRLSERMNIPGFRQGQAPKEMVMQKAGEMTVLQEAAELAVQKTLPEAIQQESLETVGQPSIAIEKLAPENPFTYSAIAPLLPNVEVGNAAELKVEKESVEVTKEEVQKVIDNLRNMRAKEILAEREAKNGDKVEVNFKVFLDSIPVDGGSSDKYPLVLGENSMIPGFEEQVVGMKADEEKEFKLKFPDEYHNEQLAGKEADFKVKLLAVYDRVLPEVNEAFAKEIGNFETIEAMQEAIEKNIKEEKGQKADRAFEEAILEGLLKTSRFEDIPEVMVNQELQAMVSELEQNLLRQGLDLQQYLTHLKKDRKQLMLDFTPDAVKRIKIALLIRTLAKEQNIEASEEEIKEELDKQAHAYEGNTQVLEHLNSPAYKDYVGNMIRNRKTIHWLKDQQEKK